ncbi:MAG: HDOD domain-containing protein [Methylococcales bacterium]|nr:HDOD domain-containing protein [Methylococcales bacterium]
MRFTTVQSFLDFVQEELEANRLVLPTLPDIALKVRGAVDKGDASAVELAQMIATDASVSARLIQVANSPLYRGGVEIKNIQMAVTRLGMKTTRSLVTSIVMQQLFKPSSKVMEQNFRKIWEQSTNVASISRALSGFVPNLNADEAMLAGLIHAIGKLPILTLVEKIPEFRDSPSRLEKLLDKTHTAVGKLIMDTWTFPDELRRVPSEYLNFSYQAEGAADYVELVQVAFLQSIAGTDHPATRVEWSSVPAFAKLGLAPDVEIMEIEGVPEEIELTNSMLH